MYAQLLIDLFRFLSPFLRNADLTKPTQMLYKVSITQIFLYLHFSEINRECNVNHIFTVKGRRCDH